MRTRIAAIAIIVGLTQVACWGAKVKEIPVTDEFARVQQFDKARELAQKRKAGLAVYVLPREIEYWLPDCPKCRAEVNARASTIGRAVTSSATGAMVKVVIYDGETRPEALSKTGIAGHGVYFTDTDLNLLGKVAEDKALDENLPRIAAGVSELLAWKSTAAARIETAVKTSISGRIADALKALQQVEDTDRKAAAVIAKNWAADGVAQPAAKGQFFAEATDAARQRIAENGAKVVADARELLEKGQLARARATVAPVAAARADLPCVNDAKALLEEIEKKIKGK